jgi:Cu+-exporting ATPase
LKRLKGVITLISAGVWYLCSKEQSMENVQWKVEGMTCSNCALTVNKYLQKQGAENIAVNLINGDVSFKLNEENAAQKIAKGIESLGYKVETTDAAPEKKRRAFLQTNLQRFWFCLPFTAVLLLHMFPALHRLPAFHWLMNPWAQLALTLPPFFVGMRHFGRSAVKSLRNGMPNMNVLITIGSASAFIYSFIGMLLGWGSGLSFLRNSRNDHYPCLFRRIPGGCFHPIDPTRFEGPGKTPESNGKYDCVRRRPPGSDFAN